MTTERRSTRAAAQKVKTMRDLSDSEEDECAPLCSLARTFVDPRCVAVSRCVAPAILVRRRSDFAFLAPSSARDDPDASPVKENAPPKEPKEPKARETS